MSPAASTEPNVESRADWVRVVMHVSECDVQAITPAMPYDMAVEALRRTARTHSVDQLDLVYEGNGRMASWAI